MARFVITAGHGGTDPGAVSGVYREADMMLTLRDIVAHKLREAGHQVETDGERKQNWVLAKALTLIKGREIAVELHTNAALAPQANGVECVSLPKDKALAQRLSQAVAKALETRVRGEDGWIDQNRTARGRLAFVNAGGLILETFFITNPQERAMFQARQWVVASAIVEALTK